MKFLKEQNYSRIIQIVDLGFPVNSGYFAWKYFDEHTSYYYPHAALFGNDIPMIRLFLGYAEELSEDEENDLKEISGSLYLSYRKIKSKIIQG